MKLQICLIRRTTEMQHMEFGESQDSAELNLMVIKPLWNICKERLLVAWQGCKATRASGCKAPAIWQAGSEYKGLIMGINMHYLSVLGPENKVCLIPPNSTQSLTAISEECRSSYRQQGGLQETEGWERVKQLNVSPRSRKEKKKGK